MTDLKTLLARWAGLCPDECEHDAEHESFFVYYGGVASVGPAPDEIDAAWGDVALFDCGVILGAVVYHAARRGLDLDARYFAWPNTSETIGQVWCSGPLGPSRPTNWNVPIRDAAAVLRADATARLTAYLDAVEANPEAGGQR